MHIGPNFADKTLRAFQQGQLKQALPEEKELTYKECRDLVELSQRQRQHQYPEGSSFTSDADGFSYVCPQQSQAGAVRNQGDQLEAVYLDPEGSCTYYTIDRARMEGWAFAGPVL